jgi:hypothetical protein
VRRWMHSLIVALLCLTLSVDTAKACWWRRHHTAVRSCCPARYDSAVVVLADVDTAWINEQAEASAIDDQVVYGREEPSAAEQPATAEETVVVHGPTFVVDPMPAAPAAAPEPGLVVAAQPMPVQPEVPAVLPNPVVAEEPLPDLLPVTAGPEEQAMTPEPLEPNLFDLYGDQEGDDAGDAMPLPADEAATEATPEAEETPEVEEAPPEEPAAAEAAPAAFFLPNEPVRHWTNAAGTHQAQGWLVELQADRVRILKVNGRHTTVARESLSAADSAYVSAVNSRLTAERQTAAPMTTAGL